MNYAPLTIKDSLIKNAGLGTFTTKGIPKNTIICQYIGMIKTEI